MTMEIQYQSFTQYKAMQSQAGRTAFSRHFNQEILQKSID